MKHTPGPWRVKTGTHFVNEAEGNNALIEYKWVGFGAIGDETPVLARHVKENEANARLIAAAPEMLAALEDLVAAFRNGYARDVNDETRESYAASFDALIAKARGEP